MPPAHALTLSLAAGMLQTVRNLGVEIHVRCRHLIVRRNYKQTWIELGGYHIDVVVHRRVVTI